MDPIAHVSRGELTLLVKRNGASIIATLTGSADQSVADLVGSVLQSVHEAAREGVTEAVMDLRTLEFMSSACLKAVLSWIEGVLSLDAERRYSVRFITDPSIHWQKRTLQTVRCFAPELISITTE
jgi:hypothetical protein